MQEQLYKIPQLLFLVGRLKQLSVDCKATKLCDQKQLQRRQIKELTKIMATWEKRSYV